MISVGIKVKLKRRIQQKQKKNHLTSKIISSITIKRVFDQIENLPHQRTDRVDRQRVDQRENFFVKIFRKKSNQTFSF
jgi:hypothetical protein